MSAASSTADADAGSVSPDAVPTAYQFPDLHGEGRVTLSASDTAQQVVDVEIGRTAVSRQEIEQLDAGKVILLNQHAGDPIDVLLNQKLAARGELVIVEGRLGVRIVELPGTPGDAT